VLVESRRGGFAVIQGAFFGLPFRNGGNAFVKFHAFLVKRVTYGSQIFGDLKMLLEVHRRKFGEGVIRGVLTFISEKRRKKKESRNGAA